MNQKKCSWLYTYFNYLQLITSVVLTEISRYLLKY
jgi:hypothetical protein